MSAPVPVLGQQQAGFDFFLPAVFHAQPGFFLVGDAQVAVFHRVDEQLAQSHHDVFGLRCRQ